MVSLDAISSTLSYNAYVCWYPRSIGYVYEESKGLTGGCYTRVVVGI